MKKDIYNTIKETLTASRLFPVIRRYSNLAITEQDRIGRDNFLILLEFINLQYEELSQKAQEMSDGQVVLHLLHKDITEDDTRVFEASQTIFKLMTAQGYRRVSENDGQTGTELNDFQITFDIPRFVDIAATKAALGTIEDITKPPLSIT